MDMRAKVIFLRMNEVKEHIETLFGPVGSLMESVDMSEKEFQLGMVLGMGMVVEQLMDMFPELMGDEEE